MKTWAYVLSLVVLALVACSIGGSGATAAAAGFGAAAFSPAATATASTTSIIPAVSPSAEIEANGRALTVSDESISTDRDGGAGVLVTQGGSLSLRGVDVVTRGSESIPLAVGSGGGAITTIGGSAVSSGSSSPCLYSTGDIVIEGGILEALRSEVAVIEGDASISLTEAALSSKNSEWAVQIFSTSSDGVAAGGGSFSMSGGSLVDADRKGSLFFVSNCTGVIGLSDVDVTALSGTLLTAAAGEWGLIGSNGGNAVLTADGQALTGNLVADAVSTLHVTLENGSSLVGAINSGAKAQEVSLTLDAGSTWRVTEDSYLTSLTLTGGVSGDSISNITGSGHTVFYDADSAANSALGGKTYSLRGGGFLKPADWSNGV